MVPHYLVFRAKTFNFLRFSERALRMFTTPFKAQDNLPWRSMTFAPGLRQLRKKTVMMSDQDRMSSGPA